MAPKEKLEPTKQPLTAVLLADSFTQVRGVAERDGQDRGQPFSALPCQQRASNHPQGLPMHEI
jgi:hypothetical protein